MRRIFFLGAFIMLLFAFTSNSQILLDENFEYNNGDSLTAHGWTWVNSYVNTILVATGNLTYAGYANSNIGNMVRLHNNGQDVYRQHDSVNSSNIYISFLVNVDSAQATGDYFFALLPNNSTTNYTSRFYIKDTSGSVTFGLSKGSSASTPIVWASGTYIRNTTYLVVIKYSFLTGSTTDDEMRAYIFSSGIPGTEPVTATIGPVTGAATNDAPNISRIVLRQGSATLAPTLNIDGFRVFKLWANIVGIRPISTVAEKFTLSQNYPNPFNPATNIRFSIPERGAVSLKVFDMLGREVSNLVDGNFAIGTYEVNFDAKGFGSGTYIYRMSFESETGRNFVDTKKMILVK